MHARSPEGRRHVVRGLLVVAAIAVDGLLSLVPLPASPVAPGAPTFGFVALFLNRLRFFATWGVLAPGVWWLGRTAPMTRGRLGRSALFHVAAPVFVSALLMLVARFGVSLGGGLPSPDAVRSDWPLAWLRMLAVVVPRYWLVLGLGEGLRLLRDREADRLRTATLERGLATAQLQALRLQLQPRFLLDTLDGVGQLARAGETRAVMQVVERLGRLLRVSMDNSARPIVTLGEELSALDDYLGIARLRAGCRLRTTVRVAPGLSGVAVPNLVLQPLVEEAIARGLSGDTAPCTLDISASRDDRALSVAIRDDGPRLPAGWAPSDHGGPGLRNLVERLEATLAAGWQLDMAAVPSGGNLVTLRVPLDGGAGSLGIETDGPDPHDHR